jgi:hypothetical protein
MPNTPAAGARTYIPNSWERYAVVRRDGGSLPMFEQWMSLVSGQVDLPEAAV